MKLLDPQMLDVAIAALADGELIVVPTERWYMICADAANPFACDRIFQGKRRPTTKSLAYVLPTPSEADTLFVLTDEAKLLAAAFWPGDLAMILPWRDPATGEKHPAVGATNALVTCGRGVLGDIAQQSAVPIAATTVNLSGDGGLDDPGPAISVAEVEHFAEMTGMTIAYCLTGGVSPYANHLTIVDCTNPESAVTRPGLVHPRAIAAVLRRST